MGSKSSKQAAEPGSGSRKGKSKKASKFPQPDQHKFQQNAHAPANFQQQSAQGIGQSPQLGRGFQLTQPRYRPLDQSQGELRLLRILAPTQSTHIPDSYQFNPDIVQCQLEYESMGRIDAANQEAARSLLGSTLALDMMFANMPPPREGMDERVLMSLKEGMRSDLMRKVDKSRAFRMHPRRSAMLQEAFLRYEERLKTWLPANFTSYTSLHKWESWLETWIWNPLSGDEQHPEIDTPGYFALSYVWSDARSLGDVDEHTRDLTKLQQAGGLSYADTIKAAGLEAFMEQFEGGQSGKGYIMVDGGLVEVSRNLEKSLRSLREIPEVQLGKRIWVDSLCINQRDVDEKNHEVARMGEIYKKAERVVSWLGDEDDYSGDVLDIMNVIGQSIVGEDDMAELSQWFFENIRSEMPLRLAQLLSRPYWFRIWITQEVVLGNDKAITICGARRFPTAKLLTFGPRMTSTSPTLHFNNTFDLAQGHAGYKKPVSAMTLSTGLAKLRDLRQLQVNLGVITGEPTPASTFWFRTASTNFATDPRDTVYGMMNILPTALRSLIKVDYSPNNTYRDVMISFAIANFTSTQSLFWLLHIPWSPFPGWQNWPSWIPNVGLKFSLAHFNWTLGSNCNGRTGGPSFFKAVTSGDSYGMPKLAVNGLFIDTISEVTTSHALERRRQNEPLVANPHLADEVAQLAGIPPDVLRKGVQQSMLHTFPDPQPIPGLRLQVSQQHRYGDYRGLQDALNQCFQRMTLRTLDETKSIFDIPLSFLEHELPDQDSAAMMAQAALSKSAYHDLKSLLGIFGNLDLWGIRFRDLFAGSQTSGGVQNVPELTVFDRTPNLARLFKTCSGYVGTALCPLRPGDQIYIISGCSMPVALRPSDQSRNSTAFEMLGGVFVPGIMHGEAWQSHPGQMGPRSEVIVLV